MLKKASSAEITSNHVDAWLNSYGETQLPDLGEESSELYAIVDSKLSLEIFFKYINKRYESKELVNISVRDFILLIQQILWEGTYPNGIERKDYAEKIA